MSKSKTEQSPETLTGGFPVSVSRSLKVGEAWSSWSVGSGTDTKPALPAVLLWLYCPGCGLLVPISPRLSNVFLIMLRFPFDTLRASVVASAAVVLSERREHGLWALPGRHCRLCF